MIMPKQHLLLRKDGLVKAAEVGRALGRDLGKVHAEIGDGTISGTKIGARWYVRIEDLVRERVGDGDDLIPADSIIGRNLLELVRLVQAAREAPPEVPRERKKRQRKEKPGAAPEAE